MDEVLQVGVEGAEEGEQAVHAADGSGLRHYVNGDAFDGRFVDGTFEALPKDVIAEGLKNGRIKYGTTRSAGIADFSTTRVPFEFIESPAIPTSSSNENSQ